MKILITTLLFFFTVSAQTLWYIDRDATGSKNGTSWANAWNRFEQINWASISPGDTVYVSGGSDSLVYAMNTTIDPDPDVSFSPYVVVCPSWESGRNGKVVITNATSNQLYILLIRGISGLKMTGFTVRDTRNPANVANGTIGFGDISNPGNPVTGRIHVDNFHIISNGTVGNLNFECRDTVIVSNTISEYTTNNLLNEADPLTFTCADNYILIEGCTLIQRNTSTLTDAHRDMMQFNFDSGLGSSIDVVIRNNIAIQTSTEGTSWNAFVYSSTSAIDTTKWYIYNNVFVSATTGSPMGGVFLYNDSGVSENYWIWNNTFIMNDAGNGLSRPMNAGNNYTTDTIFFQNNLVIEDAPINLFFSAPIFFYKVYYRLFDHNGWFEYGGLSNPFMNGDGFGSFDYSTWQAFADGNDVNSITGNSTSVTFVNKYGTDITDYYTETGRDLGVDIGSTYSYLLDKFPDLDTDILGNPRTGAWDMGALEFQDGGQSNNVNVKSKVLLQGPFNNNSMMTNLSQNGLLPVTQPFNNAPWNYNGNETLGSGSTSSYVDWVLVELRNSSNPTQIVARKAALLKNDGTLLNTDGNAGVPFSNVQEGSYYIAVFQRNHLAVMSTTPVQLSANSQVYDFTTGMDKAYGTNPMKDLGNGRFGMYAGDGNGNGGITITDRNEIWLPQNGTMGYLQGDFNLDGGVTASDVNLYWNINNGTMTQVP